MRRMIQLLCSSTFPRVLEWGHPGPFVALTHWSIMAHLLWRISFWRPRRCQRGGLRTYELVHTNRETRQIPGGVVMHSILVQPTCIIIIHTYYISDLIS